MVFLFRNQSRGPKACKWWPEPPNDKRLGRVCRADAKSPSAHISSDVTPTYQFAHFGKVVTVSCIYELGQKQAGNQANQGEITVTTGGPPSRELKLSES